jgi:hypothetical protein
MLGVQAAGGGETLADRADRERGAVQHPKGGIAERIDTLGMQVMLQHAAKHLPNLVGGEPLLPDDHCSPRLAVAGREICLFTRRWKSSGRIRKDMPTAALVRFFPESSLRPPDSFVSLAK